jgi:WSC domain
MCFKSMNYFHGLLVATFVLVYYVVRVCVCVRQNFKFAGAQNGSMCFCGNTFGIYGSNSTCNVTCTGDSNVKCGGELANTVMFAGITQVDMMIERSSVDILWTWNVDEMVSLIRVN